MARVWITILALLAGIWAGSLSADQSGMEGLRGAWEGPWYIGMSSGKARLEIDASGAGTIAFTNLENFGDQPVALGKVSFDGKIFRFSASGDGTREFSADLQLRGNTQLRGNGKYGGFGARLELKRAD
jgi:hypothetical protein